MPDTPKQSGQDEGYVPCPHCTILIPVETEVCPLCRQPVLSGEVPQPAPPVRIGMPAFSVLWERHGKWVKAAGPILAALVVLFLVYQRRVAYSVTVMENPLLPLRVEEEREGDVLVLRGTVTNRGEDIPDLSLRSVGVIAEFVYRDGRQDRKTVFPKAEFRGEGALLRGETGKFEVEGSAKELAKVILKSEIVDLGMGRKFIPSRRR